MTANPLEEATRRVLNDRRIFWMPQELINKAEWVKIREAFSRSDSLVTLKVIAQAKDNLAKKISAEKDPKEKQHLEEARRLLNGLEDQVRKASPTVRQLLEQLESFGPLVCNLPNLEDFGKVIEGHGRPTAEQFFLYKIQKEKDQRRRQALTALFEVLRELYDRRVEPLEIAFFVRKIDSLTQLVEVLKS